MTNLNNVLGNNNVEGGNKNMRGPVVIKATRKGSRDTATKLTKDTHDAMTKNFMKKLYSWTPVFKVITITGTNDEGNLLNEVYNTTGGNSPVMRELVSRIELPKNKEIEIVQKASEGKETYRKVMCGVETKNNKMKYDYVEDIVLVQFKDFLEYTEKQKEANELLVSTILDRGLTIVIDAKGKKDVRIGKELEDGDTAMQYVSPFIWTPSNERNGQILMTSLDHKEAWDILETVGGGSITKLLRQGEMPIKKFKKLASRMGLFATPAIDFGKIGTKEHGLLIIRKKIKGSDDFDVLSKGMLNSIGVDIDDNQFDGAIWFSAEWMAECFSKLGLRLIPQQALMFAAQLRVNKIYAKVFGEALMDSTLNKMSETLRAMYSEEDYIIIGNPNNISMIVDDNGAKLLGLDIEELKALGECDVFLLDIAKGTKSGSATQMTDKMAIKDKEATCKFLYNQAIKDCHDFANSIGDTSSSLLEDKVDVANYLINLAKVNGSNSDITQKVFTDQFIVSGILKDVSRKHEAAVRKGRVSLDSLFQRATFDITYILSNGKVDSLLGEDSRGAIECYSTDVLEEKREAIDAIENDNTLNDYQKDLKLREVLTACIIKYPTPGTEEIELVSFLTEKQIYRRLENLVKLKKLEAREAVEIYNYFLFTSFGTIKICADNSIKHKLAGFDTDYDGFSVVFEKELVAIIEKVYLDRNEELQEQTGTNATHGGTIPYIDCSHDSKNYIKLEDEKLNIKTESIKDEMEVWKEYFLK